MPYADEPDDQGRNRNARTNDHAGAEGGGGDAQVRQRLQFLRTGFQRSCFLLRSFGPRLDALLREANTGERRQVEREQPARVADRHATPKLRNRALEQVLVGQRAENVRDGVARRIGQLHAVHEHGRVEHADADPEHADGHEIEDQFPGGRLGQSQPDHRLHQHGHAAHAGDRRGHRLHVIRAVPASTWPPMKNPMEKFMNAAETPPSGPRMRIATPASIR